MKEELVHLHIAHQKQCAFEGHFSPFVKRKQRLASMSFRLLESQTLVSHMHKKLAVNDNNDASEARGCIALTGLVC